MRAVPLDERPVCHVLPGLENAVSDRGFPVLAYLACGPDLQDTHGVALGHGVGLEMLTTQFEVGDTSLGAEDSGQWYQSPRPFGHNQPDRARIPPKKGKQ